MIRIISVIIVIFFLTCFATFSQQPLRFERLGRNEGLSQSSVNCILRDSDGLMWFGTQDGLNLYDGRKFRVFQNEPGNTNSLSNNYIVSICEDEEGFIWIGTMAGGLNRFDKKSESFISFQHSDSLNSISENTVWTVLSDGKGNIWAGTSYGLNRYNKITGQFKSFRPVPGDTNSLITDLTVSLFKDLHGKIWVGTVEGLCLYDEQKENFIRYYNPLEKELKGANIIWALSQAITGEIITGTDNGVYLLNAEWENYRRILGSSNEQQLVAWSVMMDAKQRIWVGSHRGLFRIDELSGSVTEYLNDPKDPATLSDNNVWCLLADPSGFIWSGTNNGICKIKIPANGMKLLSADTFQPHPLSSSRVMAILEDKTGNLWIGTDGGGLNCINRNRDGIKVYNSRNSGLRNDNVWALAEDASGNIYIGNYQGGLHKFDPASETIQAYPLNSGDIYSLSNRRVLALLVDRDGYVWIGTRGGGLSRLDPKSGQFSIFAPDDKDTSSFPSLIVLALAMSPDGHVWAGTLEGGLALFLKDSGKFKVFKHEKGNVNSLSDNNVWSIEFDHNGRMWLGTQGGLNFTDSPGVDMSFHYLSGTEGLKSNVILGVKEDADGDIWISTFAGLARLNMELFLKYISQQIRDEEFFLFNPLLTFFDADHGLQGLEFNQGASFKGKDGTIYFGGNNGLNYFSGPDISASSYQPPVVLTSFKIFNKEVQILPEQFNNNGSGSVNVRKRNYYSIPENISYLKSLVLTYRESVISFEFSSLDYFNTDKNLYAYKMEGFDENWNYMGTQNTATYTNLDPGNYRLLIRGSNSDGVWNTREKELNIIIQPPFYKTFWFIAISVIFILAGIVLIVSMLLRNQRRKAEREKELIELQLKTIKSQIDPHFAFNAINTITSFIFADKPDITYDYFTRFARMIRNILEDNENISRTLNDEIDFVKNYLELQKMRFGERFEYKIQIDEDVPLQMQVPKMVIQSYAENAIKHGLMHRIEGGVLSIIVAFKDQDLELIIEDNGIGREKAAELSADSTKRGYRIMETTINLYSKLYKTSISQEITDLKDESGNACGTRVKLMIRVPVDKEDKPGNFFTKILKSR